MPANNQTASTISYPAWSVWLLVLLVFVSHGMLLLNDGVYWDGWMLYGYYLNHDVESLLGIFNDAGNPGTGYFHWAFWAAPNLLFAYRLVTIFGILLSTLLVYFMVQRVNVLSARERWFIAAMFCCYSAYQAHVEIITTPALLAYTLFLLGLYIALRSFETAGRTALVQRVIALVITGFSFRYNSLLVFYFPFLILFLMGRKQEWLGKDFRRKLIAVTRYGDFILLPFVYWGLSRLLWKRQNEYAEYNHLIFDPKQWALDFWQSINNAIFAQFHNVKILASNRPLLAIALIVLAIVAERYFSARQSKKAGQVTTGTTDDSRRVADMFKIALFALFLLVCALFPYLVVGKFPSAEGWDTRHALLVSFPVAVGLVAIGRSLHFIYPLSRVPHLSGLLAGLLVVAFTLVTCKIYLEWQVRWIKDSSFIVNLRALPKAQTDRVNIIVMTVDDFTAGYEFYRFYEYAAIFKMAWGNESKIGFHSSATHDAEWVIKNLPLRRTLLKDFRADGCQANVTIHPRHPETSRIKLVAKYYWYRWFSPAEMPAFLADATIVGMKDLTCPTSNPPVPSR